MNFLVVVCLAMSLLSSQTASANSKESGSSKAIKKLQMMVQEATAERDRIKAESAKMMADLDQAKKDLEKAQKDLEKEKKDKAALEKKSAANDKRLTADLANQKRFSDEVRDRLDKAIAKLNEVIGKYNALSKAKNELTLEHTKLQATQQFTATELKTCEGKNVTMFEGAKQVIDGYKRCQDKDLVDVLTDSEPATQINNVGFEQVVQDYEDKIYKQKFHPSPAPKVQK